MKKYETKYDLGEEVYFIYGNKIHKKKIDKIQINIQQPYNELTDKYTIEKRSGIEIKYLFLIEDSSLKNFYTGAWINENNVFKTRGELISNIE